MSIRGDAGSILAEKNAQARFDDGSVGSILKTTRIDGSYTGSWTQLPDLPWTTNPPGLQGFFVRKGRAAGWSEGTKKAVPIDRATAFFCTCRSLQGVILT